MLHSPGAEALIDVGFHCSLANQESLVCDMSCWEAVLGWKALKSLCSLVLLLYVKLIVGLMLVVLSRFRCTVRATVLLAAAILGVLSCLCWRMVSWTTQTSPLLYLEMRTKIKMATSNANMELTSVLWTSSWTVGLPSQKTSTSGFRSWAVSRMLGLRLSLIRRPLSAAHRR